MNTDDRPVAAAEHETNLFDVWAVFRRRYGIILFGLVAGLLMAALYYFQATVLYESETEILVMKKDANLPSQGAAGTQDLQGSVGQDLLATHMQILRSPRIIQRALEQRNLERLPSILERLKEDQEPVEYVLEQLEVTRGGEGAARDAHVLSVRFRHTSPEDSAAVLNAVVESYQDFLGETFQDFGKDAVELIQQVTVELSDELDAAEIAYRGFLEEAPLLWKGNESLNVHQQRLSAIEARLSDIRLRSTETESRLATINDALSGQEGAALSDLELLSLLDNEHVARLGLIVEVQRGDAASEEFLAVQPARSETARAEYERLLDLKMRERTLLFDLGEGHPNVRDVREQIRVMEEYLNATGDALQVSIDGEPKKLRAADVLAAYKPLLLNDLKDLKRRDQELSAAAELEREGAKSLVAHELEADTLRKQVDRKQAVYDTVLQRLRDINLMKDYGGFITEVISPVKLGEEVWPLAPLVFGLGGALGLVMGTGLALLVDHTDATFRSPEEVRRALGLPLLVRLPRFKKGKSVAAADSKIDPLVVAYHQPPSRQAEAFRSLRTVLYFGSHAAGRKIIQVTSPNPGDGKTTAAVNLAVSLAQAEKKVLLIDADLRRPRIADVFGVASEAGLSTTLVGGTELVDAVCESGVNNLWLMPSGPAPPNPAELLSLPAFEHLLAVVKEKYDYVVLDSPPLLAVSDPATIAARADGVLLVVRITKNGRPGAIHAKEILTAQDADIIGVVLNDVDHQATRSYGYGYGYAYGNGNGDGGGYYDGAVQAARSPDAAQR